MFFSFIQLLILLTRTLQVQYFRSGILRHVNLPKETKKIQYTTVELDETDKPLSGDLLVRSKGTDSRTVRAVMDRKTLFCWDNNVPCLVIPVSGCFVETNEDRKSLAKFDIALVSAFKNSSGYILTASSLASRNVWARRLRIASLGNFGTKRFDDAYGIGTKFAEGRTAVVCDIRPRSVSRTEGAIKIVDKTSLKLKEIVMLRKEYNMLRLLDHPRVVSLLDVFENREDMKLVMRKASGGTLLSRIQGKPVLSENLAARVIRNVLKGIAYLHENQIAHRDIKPENILCGENIWDIRIADFGFACYCRTSEWLVEQVGTWVYIAPEILKGQEYKKSCDIWSLGVVTFCLLCGRLPFGTREEILKRPVEAFHIASPKQRKGATPLKNSAKKKKRNGESRIDRSGLTTIIRPREETSSIVQSKKTSVLSEVADGLSSNCLDFLENCMNRNVSDRESASALLDHPWFLEEEELVSS